VKEKKQSINHRYQQNIYVCFCSYRRRISISLKIQNKIKTRTNAEKSTNECRFNSKR